MSAKTGKGLPIGPQYPRLATLGLPPSPADHVIEVGGSRIESTVTVVTPEMAARWLEVFNNVEGARNRIVATQKVVQLRRQMEDGYWRVSPQNVIAFDENGHLLDGQHRLRAISGLTDGMEFVVQAGWPRDAFAVMDSGITRRASQLLEGKHASVRTAAARILVTMTGMAPPFASGDITARPINSEQEMDWVAAFPELDGLVTPIAAVYKATKINTAVHAAVLVQAARTQHAHRIGEWLDGLLTGADLSATDPRLALRAKWHDEYRELSGSSSNRTRPYMTVVKSWNFFVTGKPVARLTVGSTEAIPAVAGFRKVKGLTK